MHPSQSKIVSLIIKNDREHEHTYYAGEGENGGYQCINHRS